VFGILGEKVNVYVEGIVSNNWADELVSLMRN